MEVLYPRCCGLDVHRNMVVACVLIIEAGQRRKEIRTFRSVTKELLALRQWLLEDGCTHVGMESTGVLWRPVYDRLGDMATIPTKLGHLTFRKVNLVLAHAAIINVIKSCSAVVCCKAIY